MIQTMRVLNLPVVVLNRDRYTKCSNRVQFCWNSRLWSDTLCGYIKIYVVPDTKFMGPTWDPPGSCRPQMGLMLAPWTLLSGVIYYFILHYPQVNTRWKWYYLNTLKLEQNGRYFSYGICNYILGQWTALMFHQNSLKYVSYSLFD